MTMILKEGDSIALWYHKLPEGFEYDEDHEDGDWLCYLGYEEKEGNRKLVLTYRFRYYTKKGTGNPFEDGDIKKWWSAEISTTETYALLATRQVAQISSEAAGQELTEILFKDDFDAAMKKFMDSPFAWAKQATKEEAAEFDKKYGTPKS